MSRPKRLCPFSKRLCRECPIFRGRHFHLCSTPKDDPGIEDSSKSTDCGSGSRADDFEQWKRLRQTGITKSLKWLTNIEDYFER